MTSYATLLDCREISDNLVKCTDYPRKASSPPPLVITPSFAKSPPSTRFDETANSRVGMIKEVFNTETFFSTTLALFIQLLCEQKIGHFRASGKQDGIAETLPKMFCTDMAELESIVYLMYMFCDGYIPS